MQQLCCIHAAIMLQRCAKNTADVLHMYGNQQRHRFPEPCWTGIPDERLKNPGQ
jgi:hypothetical protein